MKEISFFVFVGSLGLSSLLIVNDSWMIYVHEMQSVESEGLGHIPIPSIGVKRYSFDFASLYIVKPVSVII